MCNTLQSRAHSDNNFKPMRKLQGVSDEETADCVSVIGSMVFGLAQTVNNDETSGETALLNTNYGLCLAKMNTVTSGDWR